ncbi:hypothetical protein [Streptomyces chartreusis]|uniref:hypothetical protein n=1 Tax=Streptomyces chartreusis TaxID=1969 RepID=UPI003813E2EA
MGTEIRDYEEVTEKSTIYQTPDDGAPVTAATGTFLLPPRQRTRPPDFRRLRLRLPLMTMDDQMVRESIETRALVPLKAAFATPAISEGRAALSLVYQEDGRWILAAETGE